IFPSRLEKHWLAGDPVRTHFLNTMTLIFPDVEEYLIRSAKASQGRLTRPELRNEIRSFIGQEAQHLSQHKRFFSTLKGQGYRIDFFLKPLRFVMFNIVERHAGVALNLAISVGGEHVTATGSEYFLTSGFVNAAPDALGKLFRWHWAEEIEHKSVLF